MIEKGIYSMNKLWLLAKLGLIIAFGIKASHLLQAFNKIITKELYSRYDTEVIEKFEKLFDTDISFKTCLMQAQRICVTLRKVDVETRLMTSATLNR